jgi:hypothetical protein
MRTAICQQIPRVSWIGGETSWTRCEIHTGLTMPGRRIHIRLSQHCQNPASTKRKLLLESLKVINPQTLTIFRPNWSKQGVKHYVLRYTNLLVLYGIRRNCHSSGRDPLPYQFIKRVIRLTATTIGESPSHQLSAKLSNNLLARTIHVCQRSHWISSVWVPPQ